MHSRSDQEDFLDYTLKVWQPRTSRKLNREDARQIYENLTGFFQILMKWDASERQSKLEDGKH